jgi:hypothetical protein
VLSLESGAKLPAVSEAGILYIAMQQNLAYFVQYCCNVYDISFGYSTNRNNATQYAEALGDWDMKPYERATNSSSTLDRLDQVRMSPGERRTAMAFLRQSELLAAMLMRVDADLRHLSWFVGRGIGAFARRSKVPAVTPEPN